MPNDYYNASGWPVTLSFGASVSGRSEMASIAAAFDKMVALTGNASKFVRVNAGASAQEAVSSTGSGNVVLSTAPTITGGDFNGTIGGATPAAGAFTTLAASGAVSGAGFTSLFASPPALGGTVAAAATITNLTFSGASRRVTGDFSNATRASRTLIRNSSANTDTYVGAISNGTAVVAGFEAYGGSDPDNAAFIQLRASTGEVAVVSSKNGAGVVQPMNFYMDGTVYLALTTMGVLELNGGQLKFPATQNPSSDANTLDDYEEGTWTPAITFATAGNLAVAYSVQNGTYEKIGRRVFLDFSIATSSFTHTTAAGALRISGLPFTVGASVSTYGALGFGGITKAGYTQFAPGAAAATTYLTVLASGSAVVQAALTEADVPTGGSVVLYGQISYRV